MKITIWNKKFAVFLLMNVSTFCIIFCVNFHAFGYDSKLPHTHKVLLNALEQLNSAESTRQQNALAIIQSSQPKPIVESNHPTQDLQSVYDIKGVKLKSSRGNMTGPLMRTAIFKGAVEEFNLVFEGGLKADVTLQNIHQLSLQISHENEIICQSVVADNHAHCQWTPPYSARYTIRVLGKEEIETPYTLLVN